MVRAILDTSQNFVAVVVVRNEQFVGLLVHLVTKFGQQLVVLAWFVQFRSEVMAIDDVTHFVRLRLLLPTWLQSNLLNAMEASDTAIVVAVAVAIVVVVIVDRWTLLLGNERRPTI